MVRLTALVELLVVVLLAMFIAVLLAVPLAVLVAAVLITVPAAVLVVIELEDASYHIARTTDFDKKWLCRSGSASAPRSCHR